MCVKDCPYYTAQYAFTGRGGSKRGGMRRKWKGESGKKR
jgi:hypothetical protein